MRRGILVLSKKATNQVTTNVATFFSTKSTNLPVFPAHSLTFSFYFLKVVNAMYQNHLAIYEGCELVQRLSSFISRF